MLRLQRLLENQLELHDCVDSYASYRSVSKEICEDAQGIYRIETIHYESPCSCHPETCCHFDGKVMRSKSYKKYLSQEEIDKIQTSPLTNSKIGSIHWYNTLMAKIKHIGEFLSEKSPEDEIIREWGKELYDCSKELLDWKKK